MRIVSPWQRPAWLIGVAFVGLIAAQGTGQLIFARFAYLLLALIGGCAIWAVYGVLGLRVERTLHTPRVEVGQSIRERISVYNVLPWARSLVEVVDDTPLPNHALGFVVSIPARQHRQRSWQLLATTRGVYTMGPTIIIGSDPFGLFRIERVYATPQTLWVLPRPDVLSVGLTGHATEVGHRTLGRRLTPLSPLVVSVRDYRSGDALSRVHWRSTARRGQLMVKESIEEPGAAYWVVIDGHVHAHEWRGAPGRTPIPDSTEEYAVQTAATLTHAYLQAGHDVGLAAQGVLQHVLTPNHTSEHRRQLFDALAQIRCAGNVPLARLLESTDFKTVQHTSLVIITSDTTTEWVHILRQFQRIKMHVLVVIIDPVSFAGGRDIHAVTQVLAVAQLPYVVLRRGDTLATAWQQRLSGGR
jgi:uncharacterized protein (DUF58 family)